MKPSILPWKRVLKEFLPPIAIKLFRNKYNKVSYVGMFKSWQEAECVAADEGYGYSDPSILERVLNSSLEVKAGRAVFERDSVCFHEIEYRWPLLSSLLYVSGLKGNKLHVLDFGGSLGSCFFQHQKMLSHLEDIQWAIVEQESFVQAGKSNFENETLSFYRDMEAAYANVPADFCLFNSVLQFIADPYDLLLKAYSLGVEYVFIDLTPFSELPSDLFAVQRVPEKIYKASYPVRIFSLREFAAQISQQWETLATVKGGYASTIWEGESVDYRGYFLKRK